ncbi:MAG TPA: sugar nucleotide-binding protein [Pseudomonadales bacterium]|nr:sugar nucleotide-binding protein [Pseudomonadales bacterium]
MVLVLGAESYIGRVFCAELRRRGYDFILPAAREYCDFNTLFDCVRKARPAFVIEAAGCLNPDTDIFEPAREEVLRANTILPRYLAQVCLMTNTPWGHTSSCGIYSGAKVVVVTGLAVAKKMSRGELLRLIAECPEKIRGFTESDEPNFSFRATPCNFFSGTVALAEEAIRGIGRNYIWRLGQPFNERGEPENFLQQIQTAEKIYDGASASSHTGDFVRACLDLWERGAPYGTYNVANPGLITNSQIAEMVRKIIKPARHFEFWRDDVEFYSRGNRVQHSDYVLDVSKLLATGVTMRPVSEAIEDSLNNWRTESTPGELHKAAA